MRVMTEPQEGPRTTTLGVAQEAERLGFNGSPLRPLPEHQRRPGRGSTRRVDHAGGASAGDVDHPARHDG